MALTNTSLLASAINFFCFLIIFTSSLTSAMLLFHLVVTMALPETKSYWSRSEAFLDNARSLTAQAKKL